MTELRRMKDFWNETAQKYGEKTDFRPVLVPSSKGLINWYIDYLQKSALANILRRLSGKTVLDVGCGVGRWSVRLAENGSIVVGVDLSREMVKKAKASIAGKRLRADFVLASTTQLPFVTRTFDSVLSVTVLQHIIEEPLVRFAVADILRTTKVGGDIVLLEYDYETDDNSNIQFPAAVHPYKKYFEDKGGARLVQVQGVDPSFFLKPLNRITKKHGRYKDQLEGQQPSLRYVISAAAFYFLVSVGCIFSLPSDLAFRNFLLNYSEHKIHVFQVNNLEKENKSD
jgi:SAM-dependent methyltransferase